MEGNPLHPVVSRLRVYEPVAPNHQLTDVTLEVQGEIFRCHRAILAAAFEYFALMFNGNFKESHVTDITLHNLEIECFKQVVLYAYKESLPVLRDVHEAIDLLMLCDFLNPTHPDLEDTCISYIRRNGHLLEPLFYQKCMLQMRIYLFACASNKTRLVKVFPQYLCTIFYAACQNEDFFDIPFEFFKMMLQNLTRERLFDEVELITHVYLRDENALLDSIVRWTYRFYEHRIKYFPQLIETVDVGRVSEEYLEFLKENYKINFMSLIENNDHRLLKKSTVTECLPEGEGPLSTDSNTFFQNYDRGIHIYIDCQDNDNSVRSNVFSTGKSSHGEWFRNFPVESFTSFDRVRMTAFHKQPNNYIYCLKTRGSSREFSSYSSANLSGRRVLKCPTNYLHFFEMCGVPNDVIYLYQNDSFFRYNCHLDEWSHALEMRAETHESCMTFDSGLLYLIGGEDSQGKIVAGNAQAYDSRTSRWLKLPKTDNTYYFRGACCALNGKIYVSNGWIVEVFDSVAGKWETCCNETNKRKKQTRLDNPFHELRMIPYMNLIWIFSSDYRNFWYYTSIVDPLQSTPFRWQNFRFLNDIICALFERRRNLSEIDERDPSARATIFRDIVVFREKF